MNKSRFFFLVVLLFVCTPSFGLDIKGTRVTLGMLDKITGRFTSAVSTVGEPVKFGNLVIDVKTCVYKSPEETPENSAYIEISEVKKGREPILLFKGWMFSSTQAVALDSPIYDVWVLSCDSKVE